MKDSDLKHQYRYQFTNGLESFRFLK